MTTKKMLKSGLLIVIALILVPLMIAQGDLYGESSELADYKSMDDIASTVNATKMGIATATTDNLIIEKIGTAATFSHETSLANITGVLKKLNQGNSYEFLLELTRKIRNGTFETKKVSRTLEVYEMTPIYENVNTRAYRTRKTLNHVLEENETDFYIVELLSENVAPNSSAISFIDKEPVILRENPLILLWNMSNSSLGNQSITYFIHNIVIGDEKTRILSAGTRIHEIQKEIGNQITGQITSEESNGNYLQDKINNLGYAFSNKLIFISLFLGIILGTGIVVMELDDKRKFEGVKNLCRDAEASARVGFKNRDIIDSYICDCVEKGYHLDDIRISLIRAGWDRKAVRRLLDKYK